MLKKLLSFFALPIILSASDAFVSLKYGLTSLNQDGVDFNNNSYELDLSINQNYLIMPRFGLAYISVDEKGESVSALTQLNLEGVYDIPVTYKLTPYLFGGAGYENVSNSRKGFDSQFFLDGGLGVKYPLNESLNLISELKSLYMLSGNDQDSELVWYFGVGVNLGRANNAPIDSDGDGVYDDLDACPNTPYGVSVDTRGCSVAVVTQTTIDSDGDGVEDSRDRCPDTPLATPVDIHGCPVDIKQQSMIADQTSQILDSDGDGIEDRLDKCPHTPNGAKVNSNGCKIIQKSSPKIKKTLHIHFDPGTTNIPFSAKPKIAKFADYIKHYPNAKIKVVGYTDTSGDPIQNKNLSIQRATSVKRLLVKYGVPSSHITALGKGDLNPIAPNDTPEGREQNRRIEIIVQ